MCTLIALTVRYLWTLALHHDVFQNAKQEVSVAALTLSLFITLNILLFSMFEFTRRYSPAKVLAFAIFVYTLFFRVLSLEPTRNVVAASLIFLAMAPFGMLIMSQLLRYEQAKGDEIRKEIGKNLELQKVQKAHQQMFRSLEEAIVLVKDQKLDFTNAVFET